VWAKNHSFLQKSLKTNVQFGMLSLTIFKKIANNEDSV